MRDQEVQVELIKESQIIVEDKDMKITYNNVQIEKTDKTLPQAL